MDNSADKISGSVEWEIPPIQKKKTFLGRLFSFKVLWTILIILLYVFTIPFLLFAVPVISERFAPETQISHKDGQNDKQIAKLKSDISVLNKKIAKLTPGNVYLVINTTENKFYLYENKKIIREGLCSTGSLISLIGEGDKKWIFKTPRGDHKVRGKITNPVWHKPDWAFIEEGLPVPPAGDPSRFERNVLGDYALVLGDGYMIHGTLYQRFIGMPVTHGCVRMGDADLDVVWHKMDVGSKVYIY